MDDKKGTRWPRKDLKNVHELKNVLIMPFALPRKIKEDTIQLFFLIIYPRDISLF